MTQSDKADVAAAAATFRIDPATVTGWGVDADPSNDPTRPMRDRSKDDGPGMDWAPPAAQVADVEILQSVEYKRRPASVGTSVPPSGLSGVIRRQAFKFSESQWGHWLLLMGADRINAIEGLFADLSNGRLPNPFVEMGFVKQSRARTAAIGTAIVVLGLGALGIRLLTRRR